VAGCTIPKALIEKVRIVAARVTGCTQTKTSPTCVMTANVGDWIFMGVSGEFYPRKPEIFAVTYEPVCEE